MVTSSPARAVRRLVPLQVLDPESLHLALALDVDQPPALDLNCRQLRAQVPRRVLGAVDLVRHRNGLHPRGDVDRVAKQAVPRIPRPNDARNNRARVEAHADVDAAHGGVLLVNDSLPCDLDAMQRKLSDPRSMVRSLIPHKVRDRHVRVPDGLDLEDLVLEAQRVEARVEPIKHARHLVGRDLAADLGEAHNVAEEDGHAFLVLGLDLLALDQRLGDVLGEHVEQELL
mmetsp:Transcript_66820/g.164719  ORF Transcript_66820/g.164719 Transcript_66820/m.164719 type:complete len:229 (+) Transcript_66820:636-1322(+)